MKKEENAAEKTARWIAAHYHRKVGMIVICSDCCSEIHHSDPNPEICPSCKARMTNFSDTPRDWKKVADEYFLTS